MNSNASWPQVVYSVMLARWPEFAGLVVNESMAIMAANTGNVEAYAQAPVHAGTVGRKEHHSALRQASAIFLESLKVANLDAGVTSVSIPLTEDDDQIVVQSIPFSKRHFAKNYKTQFANDVQSFYCATYGYVDVTADLTDSALILTLVQDTEGSA